jgi:uncharacterized protein
MLDIEQHLASLPAHIRDSKQSAPPHIEQRRLDVYRELFFSNLDGLFSSNFPVLKKILGETQWNSPIQDFLREHQANTPLFPEIAREMLRYLEARSETQRDPDWWLELAHYEWVELALDISEAEHPYQASDAKVFSLDKNLELSPLAWPLAYQWPVHQMSTDYLPDTPPDTATLLLVRRDPDYKIRFSELSPLSFRLLHAISEQQASDAATYLNLLADAAAASDRTTFIDQGEHMLRAFIEQRILYYN